MSLVQRLFFFLCFLVPFSVQGQSLNLPKAEPPLFLDPHQHRVVLDGEPVDENSPAVRSVVQVIIEVEDKVLKCTGVIVSSQFIMTSGHCLSVNNPQITIRFTHQEEEVLKKALDFRYVDQGPPSRSGEVFVDGYLVYDPQRSFDFHNSVRYRRNWSNFPQFAPRMMDIALIKVSSLPTDSQPLAFYQGELSFRQEVVAVGYGINSRNEEEVDDKAYFSRHQLIGFVQNHPENVLGWQTYSPRLQNTCYGDSGGPLLARNRETQEWEILGILTMGTNGCANSSFSTYPLSDELENRVRRWAEEMSSTQEL